MKFNITFMQEAEFFNKYTEILEISKIDLPIIKKELQNALSAAFWPPEFDELVSIKGPQLKGFSSLKQKVLTKMKKDGLDINTALNQVDDIFRARILIHSWTFLPRVVEAIQNQDGKQWEIVESIGYTSDVKRRDHLLGMGINEGKSKELGYSGYSGVHFIIKCKELKYEQKKFELQIHCTLEDAWSTFDHPFYKTKFDRDEEEIINYREIIAKQVSLVSDASELLLSKAIKCLSEKRPEDVPIMFANLEKHYGTPLDSLGKVIHSRSLDYVYLITSYDSRICIGEFGKKLSKVQEVSDFGFNVIEFPDFLLAAIPLEYGTVPLHNLRAAQNSVLSGKELDDNWIQTAMEED